MKKIEKLTKKQEKQMIEYREKCRAWGVSCEPADLPRAKKSINFFYKKMEKKRPKYVFCPSPLACIEAINKEAGREKNPTFVNSWLWGQMDYYWIAFYRFAEEYLKIEYSAEDSESLKHWEALAQSIGWWWPYEDICFVSDRPKAIHLNTEHQLHNSEAAAVEYRDGYSLYLSNGIRMPKELILTPTNEITSKQVLTEQNVDVRRELIRKIGMPRFCELTNAVKVDTAVVEVKNGEGVSRFLTYDLIDLELDGKGLKGRYLRMDNPSVKGAVHVEGVPNETNTVQEAIVWRNNGREGAPVILT